jgi:hypothetical protein
VRQPEATRFGVCAIMTWAIVPLVSGCGETQDAGSLVTRSDSAGVTVVEIEGRPDPIGTFQVETVFEHGLRPGDYEFQYVFIGALRPDGSAVVSDGGNREVLEISPDGVDFQMLATFGRGPSEVARASSVHALGGDSVLIEDDSNTKMLLFVGGNSR